MLRFFNSSEAEDMSRDRCQTYVQSQSSLKQSSNVTQISTHQIANKKPVGGKFKRLFDVVIATLILLFIFPFMLVVWALIRLESKGPGLFKQARGGIHGQAFEIYKFRTMVMHGSCFKQAVKGDKRITRLGRLLRKTSIDELPQLINVVKGDMSLVGPRPHVVAHDKEFMEFDSRYALRFQARPGVTGLAQVSGSRGPTDTPELKLKRIELDLDYVEQWSHKKDFYVLIKTVLLVLFDRRAF
ncbi:sugar transferase [Hirschia litorea]|uniref:Sugar transferase n=1 Tax=Hirschia litorea TaxID=1199156 RepID=A0ABW2IQ42_9PROT